ncbi:MAG TPA: GNAT family N-acetyltransferase, partial [Vicinamibacterales bacterium]|nr:GNAT family N-acetyltransferase [Vicinamibacterales bacterium]
VRHEAERTASLSFCVEMDGALVAVCPLYRSRRRYAGVLPISVLHTGIGRAGPAIAAGIDEPRRTEILAATFAYIDGLAAQQGAARLEIRLPTLARNALPPRRTAINPLVGHGFSAGVKYGRALHQAAPVDKIVRLDKPIETLFAAMDSDCRKAVRKAKKNGALAVESTAREDLRDYHRFHLETYRRSGAAVLPLAQFERLWDAFYDRGFFRLFFAEHEGRRIAGLIMLSFGVGATYWAGSSEAAFQHLRPNNLLMFHAISTAKEQGRGWFEVGPTFRSADPRSKQALIGRFKNQFGGESFPLIEGAKNYRPLMISMLELLDGFVAGGARLWRSAGA